MQSYNWITDFSADCTLIQLCEYLSLHMLLLQYKTQQKQQQIPTQLDNLNYIHFVIKRERGVEKKLCDIILCVSLLNIQWKKQNKTFGMWRNCERNTKQTLTEPRNNGFWQPKKANENCTCSQWCGKKSLDPHTKYFTVVKRSNKIQ